MYIGFRTFIGCAVFVSVIGHSVLVSGQTATTTPLDVQTGFKSVHTRPVQTLPKIVPLTLTQEQWKQRLTKEQFRILRQKGTERRGSGRYLFHKKAGTYVCSGCGNPLFESKTKYDSGSGWPSFYQYLKGRVKRVSDRSHGMDRTEIICARCDGHLGHVFSDGPPPTGERHCVNSLALRFIANPAAP